ncbi:MAG: type II toxin-antitoxin system antitoxin SocA domain-containing protein [Syntrophorhabdus sp.]
MVPYREEKISNAICFFASEHEKVTKRPLPQTFLYKYLAFLDFIFLEKTGRPSLGLKYIAMERGPVPIEIYGNRDKLKSDCYYTVPLEENKILFRAKGEPNLDYFSPLELAEMRRLIEIYADHFVHASDISDASHEAIKAWQKAYRRKPNSEISYDDAFDDNISEKEKKDLSYAEESYLLDKVIEAAQI